MTRIARCHIAGGDIGGGEEIVFAESRANSKGRRERRKAREFEVKVVGMPFCSKRNARIIMTPMAYQTLLL